MKQENLVLKLFKIKYRL